jgi:hypothetical protein
MTNLKNLPAAVALLNKIIVAKEVYQDILPGLTDGFIKEVLERIAAEKDIFIKDFNSFKHFDSSKHIEENQRNIGIEMDNLRIKLKHLLTSEKEEEILEFILNKENELVESYQMLLNDHIEDEFTAIMLKNQKDETVRTLKELRSILETISNDNDE